MFSDNVYHEYQFKRPVELAMRVLDELEISWYGLTQAAQTELESILVAFRVELYQARDDMARGRALTKLLYALEAAAATPASIRARLTASHQPTMRDGGARWDSAAARAFVARIDALIGAAPELAPSTGPASSAEEFPEAVAVVERVLEQLNQRWSELALRTQDQAKLWLQAYERALRSADSDWLRLEATHEFLRHLKDEAEIWEKVHTAFRGPARPGPQPPFPVGAQVMTADDADWVRALIDSNPAMAVAKTSQASDGDHGPREMPAPPETEAETLPETAAESQPAAATVVDFHTDVRFPGQVSTFDRAIPLRVRLTMDKAEGTVVDAGVSIEFVTPEPQPVLVVCNAEGFVEETGDLTRTIMVYQDRDSQTAIFLLTPDPEAGPGTRRISLDFYHRERLAGTASFQVEVRDRPPIDQTPVEPEPALVDRAEDGTLLARVGGTLLLASPDAAKPDFVLRITLSADRRRLSYTLHSPTGRMGYVYQRMGSVKLEMDPRSFMENTLMGLSQMARASREKLSEVQVAEAQARLREIGWYLYEQLFTDQLKQAYRKLHELLQKKPDLSLLIISDEPWIPWEMALPHEGLAKEDFLCAQFRITRWLDGRGLPESFSVQQARVVVPKSNLASVKMEQDFFSQQLPPTIRFDGEWLDTATEVKDALRQGNSQWFHFACHGDFDATRPDESALILQGTPFTPSQIVGPMREGVATSRPLVFLNACHTGEAGFSLTGMGGWAARFVRAGASAFIGSLWEVNDTLAAEFAVKFYTELLAGQTLGDAFHSARLHIRNQDDANPTWLAYTLYADPNGRVKPVNGDR